MDLSSNDEMMLAEVSLYGRHLVGRNVEPVALRCLPGAAGFLNIDAISATAPQPEHNAFPPAATRNAQMVDRFEYNCARAYESRHCCLSCSF